MPFCESCGTERKEDELSCATCGAPTPNQVATPITVPPPLMADMKQVAAASQMAVGTAAAMQYQTYAQRSCPRCSHHMIVVFRQPIAGWISMTIGFLLLLIPILGWVLGPILIITGIVIWTTQKGKARYQCPGCNYSA